MQIRSMQGDRPMTSLLARDAGLRLDSEQDALDVMGSGLSACIFTANELHPEFFDLANGIAGGIFQKFVNYGYRIAIVLPEEHGLGPRITELAREHAQHPLIRFVTDEAEAVDWLT